MRKKLGKYIVCCVGMGTTLWWGVACSPSRAKPEPSAESGDETADVPSNISGVYLTCQTEEKATAEKPDSVIGCFMADSAGKRLDARTLSAATEYGYKPPLLDTTKQDTISVYALKLTDDPKYDSVYIAKGKPGDSAEKVTQFINETMVSARLDKFQSGDKRVYLASELPGVLKKEASTEQGNLYNTMVKNLQCEHSPRFSATVDDDETKSYRLNLINNCPFAVDVVWVDYDCKLKSYGEMVDKNKTKVIKTYIGHPWRFFRVSNRVLVDTFTGKDNSSDIKMTLCSE